MTLDELKNINDEIKIRNHISMNMIKHCFIYNPSEEILMNIRKLNLLYHQSCQEDSLLFNFCKNPNLCKEAFETMNITVDIECDENGFCSYSFVTAKGDFISDETITANKYKDMQEGDIYGVLINERFQYGVYQSKSFYMDMLSPRFVKDGLFSYQNALKKMKYYDAQIYSEYSKKYYCESSS